MRSRYGAGDSDFSRARRQQLLLLALQKKMTSPEMLPKLPSILAAAGDMIKTNFPAARLSEVLDLAKEVDQEDMKRVVLGPEYTDRGRPIPSTYMLVPDMKKFAKMSVKLFGAGQPLLRAALRRRRRPRRPRGAAAGLSGRRRGLDSAALEHRRDRAQHDLEVEPQRPAIDVVQVDPHPAIELLVPPRRDLPQPGDARLHRQASSMPDVVGRDLVG